ncbi:MAG: patatin-like phospholipase family protein [Myxococcales bacterium]|nr:patatin-like phospholipase family protein [Myxococcales bacterium]
MRNDNHAEDFAKVEARERELVRERRLARGWDPEEPRSGLAISGGGVRSAAFGLGVMRALQERGHFERLDYLSTVSGGGFSGSFVSWLRRNGSVLRERLGELVPERALRFVRENADYLNPAPRGGWGRGQRRAHERQAPTPTTLFGVVLGQMYLSLAVYGSLLIGLFFLLHIGDAVITLLKPVMMLASRSDAWRTFIGGLNFGSIAALIVLAAGGLRVIGAVLAHALRIAWAAAMPGVGNPSWSSTWRGSLWFLLALVTSALAIMAAYEFFESPATVLGTFLFGAISIYAWRACRRQWNAPAASEELPHAAWLIVPVSAAALFGTVLFGGLGFYLLLSGEAPMGEVVYLNRWGGVVVVSVAAAWTVWLVPRALRGIGRFADRIPHQSDPRSDYERDLIFQHKAGTTLRWSGILFMLGSVPWTAQLIEHVLDNHAMHIYLLTTGMALGSLWISLRVVRSAQAAGSPKSSDPGLLQMALWCAVLYGTLVLAHSVTEVIIDSAVPQLALWLLGAGLVLGLLAEMNFAGPGRIYRDRLAETFLPDARAIEEGRWFPAAGASNFRLAELSSGEDRGPYHLINCSITTSGSARSRYRHRGADGFVLSPLYCGSESTGWARTTHWLRGRMTLRDAVGISGAAVAPGTGLDGHGVGRTRLVAAALSMLNLRLGFWADNPNPRFCPRPARIRANLLRPGLGGGIFGRGLSENGRQVRLTDGGHFENLGLYELLRRRVELIVVSDASQDPEFGFRTLGLALERAREDLGAAVEFEPGTVFGGEGEDAPAGVSKRGFAVGTIRYGDDTPAGTLLYVKPALIEDLDVTVKSFAASHAEFPHEPTTDQSFDEDHFVAYEQLGLDIGRRALDDGLAVGSSHPDSLIPPRHDSMIRYKDGAPAVGGDGESRDSRTG